MVETRPIDPVAVEPRLPGDKSITHRALLLGALAEGSYRVTGGNSGHDCLRTRDALTALGVRISVAGESLEVEGAGGSLVSPSGPLDLGNSGTGLRLLLGILAGQPFQVTLTGDDSLRGRPMGRVAEPLALMGATVEGATPPVTITGGALKGITYTLPVASAQVKSALLLAGVRAEGRTILKGPVDTRDHTERLLRYFGATVVAGDGEIQVTGGTSLHGRDITVPGDPSAGAFWAALPALVPGSTVTLRGMGLNPGRVGYLNCLGRMGLEVRVTVEREDPEPMGSVRVSGTTARGLRVEREEVAGIIDELPILAAACALAPGESVLTGLGELRHKESDRLQAVARGLSDVGARMTVQGDGWRIEGTAGEPISGGEALSLGDHRVAMCLLMAGLGSRGGVRVVDAPGIETSDPCFLHNLNGLQQGVR